NPNERSAPETNNKTPMTASGVSAVTNRNDARTMAPAALEKISTGLKANLRMIGVVKGLIATFPAKSATTITPAMVADQPKDSWNNNVNMNGTAVITSRYMLPDALPTRKLWILNTVTS